VQTHPGAPKKYAKIGREGESRVTDEQKFPVGTIVYYGPDDKTVTKITAGVVFNKNGTPLRRSWVGEDVTADPIVISELGKFFKSHGVHKVVMTSGVAGCPHVEGVDYPAGEECPLCPYWQGKEG
jgi:hypothetical protein